MARRDQIRQSLILLSRPKYGSHICLEKIQLPYFIPMHGLNLTGPNMYMTVLLQRLYDVGSLSGEGGKTWKEESSKGQCCHLYYS